MNFLSNGINATAKHFLIIFVGFRILLFKLWDAQYESCMATHRLQHLSLFLFVWVSFYMGFEPFIIVAESSLPVLGNILIY